MVPSAKCIPLLQTADCRMSEEYRVDNGLMGAAVYGLREL